MGRYPHETNKINAGEGTEDNQMDRKNSTTHFPTQVTALFTTISLLVVLCIYHNREVLGLTQNDKEQYAANREALCKSTEDTYLLMSTMKDILLQDTIAPDHIPQIKEAFFNIEDTRKGSAIEYFLAQPDFKIISEKHDFFEPLIVAYIKHYMRDSENGELLCRFISLVHNLRSTDPDIEILRKIARLNLDDNNRELTYSKRKTLSFILQFLPEIRSGKITPAQVLTGYVSGKWPDSFIERDNPRIEEPVQGREYDDDNFFPVQIAKD